jgi:uncharacterized protein
MKTPCRFLLACAVVALAFAPFSHAAAPAPKKVLFFSKSSGFEHSVIKRNAGNPSFAEQVLAELGPKHNIEFTFSKDGSLFTKEYLAKFDAYFFYTTGDLTTEGTDKQPPMTKEGKAAFLAAIEGGKGFVGTHSASDTFHSANYLGDDAARKWENDAQPDPYIKMLGAEFINHGAQQKSHQRVVDAKFPGMSTVPADFGPHEEWYSQKNIARDMHVLLVQETQGMNGASYNRPPFPGTWARAHGRGRVFYTNMGHREDVWTNPVFQAVLMGGIEWATGRVKADVTPNFAKVTPDANTTPKYVSPPPRKEKGAGKKTEEKK